MAREYQSTSDYLLSAEEILSRLEAANLTGRYDLVPELQWQK